MYEHSKDNKQLLLSLGKDMIGFKSALASDRENPKSIFVFNAKKCLLK